MKPNVVLLGEGDVYVTGGGRSFHDGPECLSMLDGQLVHMCRCGDMYCGCAGELPRKPRRISIGDAAMESLKPCGSCYPGFQELAVQLPSDEDFGHQRFNLNGSWCCRTCVARWREDDGTWSEYPKAWPCTSARVLCLV